MGNEGLFRHARPPPAREQDPRPPLPGRRRARVAIAEPAIEQDLDRAMAGEGGAGRPPGVADQRVPRVFVSVPYCKAWTLKHECTSDTAKAVVQLRKSCFRL